MLTFTTLFDSNYIDKALVMFDSLETHARGYKVYVLPMDDVCENILKKENKPNIIVLDFHDFIKKSNLSKELETRKWNEFCFTCTPFLIKYVLDNYKENIVTYIDSDLFFYQNPECLINEIKEKDVQIIKHNFGNSIIDKKQEYDAGKFCVEFNSFKNNKVGKEMLNWWCERCRESCDSSGNLQNVHGDQKYLNEWEHNEHVNIISNVGAGLAPWNIGYYKLIKITNNGEIVVKRNGIKCNVVFYHFHNIRYINESTVSISVYNRKLCIDSNLVNHLYADYLRRIEFKKQYLNSTYNHCPVIFKSVSAKSLYKKMSFIKNLKIEYHKGIMYAVNYIELKVYLKLINYFNKDKNIINLKKVI